MEEEGGGGGKFNATGCGLSLEQEKVLPETADGMGGAGGTGTAASYDGKR